MAFDPTLNPATGKVEATYQAHSRTRSTPGLNGRLARSRPTGIPPSPTGRRGCGRPPISSRPSSPTSPACSPPRWARPSPRPRARWPSAPSRMRYYAEHAERLLADEPMRVGAGRSFVRYEPLGPVLAVMPWNFPLWQVFRFAAPALMAGNVGLLKHASNVPQSRSAASRTSSAGPASPTGASPPCSSPRPKWRASSPTIRVAAVTLTGSEGAGRASARAAGPRSRSACSNWAARDPFVVLPRPTSTGRCRRPCEARVQNNGQSCIAAKRFIVVDAWPTEFVAQLHRRHGGPDRRRPDGPRDRRRPPRPRVPAGRDRRPG